MKEEEMFQDYDVYDASGVLYMSGIENADVAKLMAKTHQGFVLQFSTGECIYKYGA